MVNKTITKPISIHAPKAIKPQTQQQMGYFCAGLIDANGLIDKQGFISIIFSPKDVSVAYTLKKYIRYGCVKKNKNEIIYKLTSYDGLIVMAHMIRNKLKSCDKINQFNNYVVARINCETCIKEINLLSLHNHWLAGFIQGVGQFVIKSKQKCTKNPETNTYETKLTSTINNQLNVKTEVQCVLLINYKTNILLDQIKTIFGGYVFYNKKQSTFIYSSTFCSKPVKFINYLDRYQVMGSCLTGYWLWRKAYLRIQSKAYLTPQGLAQIERFKKSSIKLSQF